MAFVDSLKNSFLGGIASTPASLVSGGLGQLFSGFSASRNWKYKQKEMALQQQYNERNMALQFDYAKQAFEMENEYNDPSNAVARWRAAGIAPQAVFGSSPGGSGVAGSLSTPDSSNPSASGVDGSAQYAPVMTLADVQRMKNETKVADSQADLNAARAEEARANAEGQQNENSLFEITKRIREAGAISAEQEAKQKTLDTEFMDWNQDNRKQLSAETIANYIAQRNKMNQEISESVSREASNMVGMREALSRIMLNNVQAALMKSQIRLNDKQVDLMAQQIEKIVSDIDVNDSIVYLNAAKSGEANERMQSIILDNFQRELRNKADKSRYLDNDGNVTFAGSTLFAIEGAFETIGKVFGGTKKL